MAKSKSSGVRDALGSAARESLKNVEVRDALGKAARGSLKHVGGRGKASKANASPLSGGKGVAAGVGLAAAAPLVVKGIGAVRNGRPSLKPTKVVESAATKAGERVGSKLKDTVGEKVDAAGGVGGIAKEAASGLLPGLGGGAGAATPASRASVRAAGCRCSRRSTSRCRWRPPTTSGPSSRTGRSSCTGSRVSRRTTTAR